MMHWGYGGTGGWAVVLAGISTILFWALIILAIIVLIRYLTSGTRSRSEHGPEQRPERRITAAEQTLADRFARGDIDEDEYRRRLETLRSSMGTGDGSQGA